MGKREPSHFRDLLILRADLTFRQPLRNGRNHYYADKLEDVVVFQPILTSHGEKIHHSYVHVSDRLIDLYVFIKVHSGLLVNRYRLHGERIGRQSRFFLQLLMT